MKKEEKNQYIDSESEELAKSGDYSGWHMIEEELSSQGYLEARRVLDDRKKRQELDELCEIARSKKEIDRRIIFNNWKNKILKKCPKIDINGASIALQLHQNYLLISCSRFDAQLGKKFNSDKIIIEKFRIFENSHAKVFSNESTQPTLKINEASCDKIKSVAKILLQRAINF